MYAIETKNLVKKYGGRVILNDVSINISKGEIYGLIGRNGAGKTTLIRLIMGLGEAESGSIKINEAVSLSALQSERTKIGSIIDQPSYSPHLSALANLKASALNLGENDEEKLRELLHIVGLNADDKLPAKNFSLGMKQRLAIAIALIGNPEILILDEPVNGLDPTGIYEVRELLKRLNTERGVTILISSHLLGELSKLATAYGVMEQGKLVREMRGNDLESLTRPFIKIVVADLKTAVNVLIDNYKPYEFEILPFNTLAIYRISDGVGETAKHFTDAGVSVVSIAQVEGDLETAFISMMGGTFNDEH